MKAFLERAAVLVSSFAVFTAFAPGAFAEEAKSPAPPPGPAEKVPQKPEPRKPALPTLLVFDLVAEKGVDAGLMSVLTESVLDKVTKTKRYQVVGQKDLDKMLFWEQNKQLKGCTDTACLVQIAGAMGAQFYVEGSVGGIGDQYFVTVKLIDASSVKVLERSTEKVSRDEKALAQGVELATETILGIRAGASGPAAPGAAGVGAPEAQRNAPVGAQSTVPVPPAFDKRFWGMTGTCAGAGVLAIGGVFTVLAKKAGDDYRKGESAAAMTDLAAKHDTYNAVAVTAYIVGGAAAATGAMLWILGERQVGGKTLSVAPTVYQTSVGANVAIEW